MDKWEIANRAGSRIGNLPSSIGSDVIVQFVEDSAQDIGNFTGQSIDLDIVGSKFFGILTNRSAAFTVAKRLGVDIDIDARIGEITATYANLRQSDAEQLRFFIEQSNSSMDALIKQEGISGRVRFDKTQPTT